jgi:hypothetical protein
MVNGYKIRRDGGESSEILWNVEQGCDGMGHTIDTKQSRSLILCLDQNSFGTQKYEEMKESRSEIMNLKIKGTRERGNKKK